MHLSPRMISYLSRLNTRNIYTYLQNLRLRLPVGKKIVLLNYTGKEANWGCVGTSNALMRIIRAVHPLCRLIPVPLQYLTSRNPALSYADIIEIEKTLQQRIAQESCFQHLHNADMVILNGEGSIHEWPLEAKRFEPYMRLQEIFAAKRIFRCRNVVSVNQSFDYWSPDFATWLKTCLPECDSIAVREPRSLKRLCQLDIPAELIPDAAFLTRSASDQTATSFLQKHGIPSGFIAFFLGEDFGKATADAVQELINSLENHYKVPLVLFSSTRIDTALTENIRHQKVFGIEVSPEILIAILKKASFTLSGRYHCCIYSSLAKTPFVPFRSNTDKIEGLTELLEYPVPVMQFSTTPLAELLSAITALTDNLDEHRTTLNRTVPLLIQTTKKGYRAILK